MGGEELRKNKRIAQVMPADAMLINRTNPGKIDITTLMTVHSATISDVSSTGVSLQIFSLNPRWQSVLKNRDSFVGVRFRCPHEQHYICAMGEVRWLEPGEELSRAFVACGLLFVDLSTTDRVLLHNLILQSKNAAHH